MSAPAHQTGAPPCGAISLVDSGILAFRSSLGVVPGANIGTTSTAWLVSMWLTGTGPLFIVSLKPLGPGYFVIGSRRECARRTHSRR